MNNPESIAAALNKNSSESRNHADPYRVARAQNEIKEGKGVALCELWKRLKQKTASLRKKN